MPGFQIMLGELRKGRALPAYDKALDQLLDECVITNKPGTITITITATPMKDEDGEVSSFTFKDRVSIKPPERETGMTVLFRNDDGELTRRDSRQPELPMIEGGRRGGTNG